MRMVAEPLPPYSSRGASPRHIPEQLRDALPGASAASLELLARTGHPRPYAVGETILRQDEPLPLTLVVDGYAAFRRITATGQQLIVGIADPGYLFGFSGVIAMPSEVDIDALTACEVATWPGSTLRQLALTDPGFALDVITRLAQFAAILTKKVEGFLHQDARVRVIRILARHRSLFFVEPAILTRSHLPGLVGTTREMTARVLRELERDGTIERTGRTGLRLLRPDRLDDPAGASLGS
jgi:CRP-like cAMP-binding protein